MFVGLFVGCPLVLVAIFVGHDVGVFVGIVFVLGSGSLGGVLVGNIVGGVTGIAVGTNDPLQLPQVTLQYAGINTGRSRFVE